MGIFSVESEEVLLGFHLSGLRGISRDGANRTKTTKIKIKIKRQSIDSLHKTKAVNETDR
jgi:hypothetical protein